MKFPISHLQTETNRSGQSNRLEWRLAQHRNSFRRRKHHVCCRSGATWLWLHATAISDKLKRKPSDLARGMLLTLINDALDWFSIRYLHRWRHTVFTALHAMQTLTSDENSVSPSVCLSVCPSVKRVICDKMEETSVQIFMSYERSFRLVFWEEKWLVGATHLTWNFWSTGLRSSEIADFQPIFARNSSGVTPSEH